MIKLNINFDYPDMPMHFETQIQARQKVAIIGESGSGKSTLLNLIAGFELPDRGEIWLNGENHTTTAVHLRPVSMLFQENNLFPHLTVWQNMALGVKPNLVLTTEERLHVEEAASAVGLTDFLTRLPQALSGGQKQRVALARCLLRNKPILLLDEPFSALDPLLRQDMLGVIENICNEKHLTLLIVTHQPAELATMVDRTLHISQGKIVYDILSNVHNPLE